MVKVESVNKKMRPQLIAYIQKTKKQEHLERKLNIIKLFLKRKSQA